MKMAWAIVTIDKTKYSNDVICNRDTESTLHNMSSFSIVKKKHDHSLLKKEG